MYTTHIMDNMCKICVLCINIFRLFLLINQLFDYCIICDIDIRSSRYHYVSSTTYATVFPVMVTAIPQTNHQWLYASCILYINECPTSNLLSTTVQNVFPVMVSAMPQRVHILFLILLTILYNVFYSTILMYIILTI